MNSSEAPKLSKQAFIESEWNYVPEKEHYGYSSVMHVANQKQRQSEEDNDPVSALVYSVLSRATSMMLRPESLNEPFQPIMQDFENGRRSAIPEDFTAEELDFLEEILTETEEPWLKARLADLLWLLRQPKNVEHARIAIDCYSSHDISGNSWKGDISNCWGRAIRICQQIRDFDRLKVLKDSIYSAFQQDHPETVFMPLWLASSMDEVKIDGDWLPDIARKIFDIGKQHAENNDFYSSRHFLEFAAKKYYQCDDKQAWLQCLALVADSFEKEADSRADESNMVANGLYEDAVQSYRKIPIKHRAEFDVENKIQHIRTKMSDTGKAAIDEMAAFTLPGIDISEDVKLAIEHVSNRNDMVLALLCFAGLSSEFNYGEYKEAAISAMQENPLSSIIGGMHYGNDGRVVAKTPTANLGAGLDDPENIQVLNHQIQQSVGFHLQLVVKGRILPALHQLLREYRFTLPFLKTACREAKFVPAGRENLMAYALWKGFDLDFGNAIHLLCPQLEHAIRTKLKEAGAHTTHLDQNGIENEIGLSSLMELPESTTVFGENLVFEIKSVFTDVLGNNLRNETAHGLLDDESANSLGSVYAWWMALRLVIHSIPFGRGNTPEEQEE